MQNKLTEEQILQLAPDDSSIKAGKGLATGSKWVLLECNERAIWGHCQGSGKNPYQTAVDLNNIAFKCSCPSRKFPCKHGLGLLLLYAKQADRFQQSEEPEWVTSWLSKRMEKAEKKEQKAKNDTPVDEAAQAKRQAQRHQKILNGIADLEIWMKDLLRNGLLNIPERAYTLFDNMARRMVDAQAPGLATRLRSIQEMNFSTERWKSELTDRLGKLYLLIRSYRHLDRLPEAWQDEIRTQIGYPQSKESVLAGEAVADRWLVLHKRSQKINDLHTDTYWFYGEQSGRFAVCLHFAVPGNLSDPGWIPGGTYSGELCFYRGTGLCRRALFKETTLSPESFIPTFCNDLQTAAAHYRRAIQENPLSEDIPVLVTDVVLAGQGSQLCLTDENAHSVTLQISEETKIDLLAITGGKPFSAFLLANADYWELKSMWYQTVYHTWRDERN